MYTDGLVERRGESIEDGIGVLGRTMAARPNISARELLSAISDAIGSPADDVALLLASIEPASSFEIELAGRPEVLPGLRRRLRAWLGRQGFEAASSDIVLAVSEALNNAIEHAYRERRRDGSPPRRGRGKPAARSRSRIAGSGSSRSRTTSGGAGSC